MCSGLNTSILMAWGKGSSDMCEAASNTTLYNPEECTISQ